MEKWLSGIEGSNDAVRLENRSYVGRERELGESPKSMEHYINGPSSSFSSMEVKAQAQQSYSCKMGIKNGTGWRLVSEGTCLCSVLWGSSFSHAEGKFLICLRHTTDHLKIRDPGTLLETWLMLSRSLSLNFSTQSKTAEKATLSWWQSWQAPRPSVWNVITNNLFCAENFLCRVSWVQVFSFNLPFH